jgi:hypothetical protein
MGRMTYLNDAFFGLECCGWVACVGCSYIRIVWWWADWTVLCVCICQCYLTCSPACKSWIETTQITPGSENVRCKFILVQCSPPACIPTLTDLLLHSSTPRCYLFESAFKPTLSDLLLQVSNCMSVFDLWFVLQLYTTQPVLDSTKQISHLADAHTHTPALSANLGSSLFSPFWFLRKLHT